MAYSRIGTCSECGAENVKVTVIDEETILCDSCMGDDYTECDNCHEFWYADSVNLYYLKDGRILCEYCAEDMLEEGELTEDEIDSIFDFY